MTRRFGPRIGSALLGALYLALPGGVAGVRACPHHDAAAVEVAPEPVHAHGHGTADGAAAEHDGSHDTCTCVGACAAGSAIALPDAGAVVPASAVGGFTVPQHVSGDAPRPARAPHFLPFPTAPPTIPG